MSSKIYIFFIFFFCPEQTKIELYIFLYESFYNILK